jgi:mannose-6-phosphate isomerase
MMELYPLKFKPIYKPYIWGGKNLSKIGKSIPEDMIVAESWEVSDHGQDVSVVLNGKLRGRTLRELIEEYGEAISPRTNNGRFPLLIKYIDANKRLSVQVHPDDEYARRHEGPLEMGKNECWYIMEALPGAELILGLKKGVTKTLLKKLIEEGRIEDALNRLPVSRGDFIYIKAGTVHALLEGTMVCEIHQNSDTTYRLYDWGRAGKNGKPRPLHIEKALDVINFYPDELYDKYMGELIINYDRTKLDEPVPLLRGNFFNVDIFKCTNDFTCALEGLHFHTLNIIEGEGYVEYRGGKVEFRPGDTLLIPGVLKNYRIQTRKATIIKSFL